MPALPDTAGYVPPDHDRHHDYVPTPPAQGSVPLQESGSRPSRALGYRLSSTALLSGTTLSLTLANTGTLGAHVQARSTREIGGPFSYTVGKGDTLRTSITVGTTYDVELHGPAGFYRRLAGTTAATPVDVQVVEDGTADAAVLRLVSSATTRQVVTVLDAHTRRSQRQTLLPHQSVEVAFPTARRGGWYDLAVTTTADSRFRRVLAGRVETGAARTSDPLLGTTGH